MSSITRNKRSNAVNPFVWLGCVWFHDRILAIDIQIWYFTLPKYFKLLQSAFVTHHYSHSIQLNIVVPDVSKTCVKYSSYEEVKLFVVVQFLCLSFILRIKVGLPILRLKWIFVHLVKIRSDDDYFILLICYIFT